MDLTLFTHPTAGGLAGAVGAVVAGAPLFSDGLRALRLRRRLRRLAGASAPAEAGGFRHLEGTVALESPLFAPLSARPCAAFRLEVHAEGAPIARTVGERSGRSACVTRDGVAHVEADGARWALPRTAEREVAADQALSGTLARLLERAPEARLVAPRGRDAAARRARARRRLGLPRRRPRAARARGARRRPGSTLLRTGTDDVADVVTSAPVDGRAGAVGRARRARGLHLRLRPRAGRRRSRRAALARHWACWPGRAQPVRPALPRRRRRRAARAGTLLGAADGRLHAAGRGHHGARLGAGVVRGAASATCARSG